MRKAITLYNDQTVEGDELLAVEADFSKMTWTFEIDAETKISGGSYLIISCVDLQAAACASCTGQVTERGIEVKELPRAMRTPKNARPISGCDGAWYYVDPRRIVVVAQVPGAQPAQVSLTRSQLERALAIMTRYE